MLSSYSPSLITENTSDARLSQRRPWRHVCDCFFQDAVGSARQHARMINAQTKCSLLNVSTELHFPVPGLQYPELLLLRKWVQLRISSIPSHIPERFVRSPWYRFTHLTSSLVTRISVWANKVIALLH